ncbi:MAG: hypothetical protein SF053_16905 [Bacteroidia bacterium]|nr:hypothetical protein [Bacteroidia bacterium]
MASHKDLRFSLRHTTALQWVGWTASTAALALAVCVTVITPPPPEDIRTQVRVYKTPAPDAGTPTPEAVARQAVAAEREQLESIKHLNATQQARLAQLITRDSLLHLTEDYARRVSTPGITPTPRQLQRLHELREALARPEADLTH